MNASGRGGWLRVAALLAALVSPLARAADRDANELERLFRDGMTALQEDRLRSAIEAFQTILASDPSLHRARLELAVAYYRALNYAEAQALAQQVLDDPATPPQVRVSILAFLAQVKADAERLAVRHSWRAQLGLGGLYDNNVNVGPSSEIVTEAFRLAPGSTARSDNGLFLQAALAHTFNPGSRHMIGERAAEFLWQTQLSAYHRGYNHESEFDLTVASLGTGPALVVLRHWRAALNLQLDYIELGGSPLARFTSLNPLVTWQFRDGEFTLDGSVGRRDYDDDADSGREGDYRQLGVMLAHYYDNRRVAVQLGVRHHDFEADVAGYGSSGPEYYLAGQWRAWPRGQLHARISQRDLDYDGTDPVLTSQSRDDRDRRLLVGFSHQFAGGAFDKWRLNGDLLRTLNASNLDLYDYRRTQINLALVRDF